MINKRLYTQLEVIELLKLPPTTVKRWLEYFSHFIPVVLKGDSKYYEYETMRIIKRVNELRQERYHLGTIVRILVEEGFPMYSPSRELEGLEMDKPGGSAANVEAPKAYDEQQIIVSCITRIADELQRLAGYLKERGQE